MLVVSDVHLALGALRRVVTQGEPVLILGDLVNLTDYRTGEGAIAEVLGLDFALEAAHLRALGDYAAMRALWENAAAGRAEDVRSSIRAALAEQYRLVTDALTGGSGYVIHGNVDRPDLLQEALPDGYQYVHGKSVEIDGVVFGFAGGGVETPVHASGEVSDSEMSRILEGLGVVDVLCSHVPPAIDPLRTDVVTGRAERGSQPILDYIRQHQPARHLFGDVHQPQAAIWRIGRTHCQNVGYFRATGRPARLLISQFT